MPLYVEREKLAFVFSDEMSFWCKFVHGSDLYDSYVSLIDDFPEYGFYSANS